METLLSTLRNVTKELFKVGIAMYDTVADVVAHTTEGVKDFAAEARAEMKPSSEGAASIAGNVASQAVRMPNSATDKLRTTSEVASAASSMPPPPVD